MSYKQTASRVGVCFLALMLITQILQIAASAAFSLWAPQLYSTSWFVWVLSYVPMYGVAVPLFLLLGRALLPGGEAPAAGPKMTAGRWLSTLALCLGLTYWFNILSTLLVMGIGMLKGAPASNPLENMVAASSLVWNLVFGCVVAPVGEELIFRKWLYAKLGRFGDRAYVLLGAAVFGLFHGNLSQLLYAIALGGVLCYVYVRTGRIAITISLHMAINLMGMVVVPVLGGTAVGSLVVAALVLAFLVAGVVLVVRGFRRLYWQGGENAPARPLAALATPGMAAYTALCLALVVITLFTAELSTLFT